MKGRMFSRKKLKNVTGNHSFGLIGLAFSLRLLVCSYLAFVLLLGFYTPNSLLNTCIFTLNFRRKVVHILKDIQWWYPSLLDFQVHLGHLGGGMNKSQKDILTISLTRSFVSRAKQSCWCTWTNKKTSGLWFLQWLSQVLPGGRVYLVTGVGVNEQEEAEYPSGTYTTAHGNAGSLSHWARPGIGPATSFFPVGFVNHWAMTGTPAVRFLIHRATVGIPVIFIFILLLLLFKQVATRAAYGSSWARGWATATVEATRSSCAVSHTGSP